MSKPSSGPAIPNRRSRKFIRPDMQLMVIFVALFVTSLTLVVQMRMGLEIIESISKGLTPRQTGMDVLNLVEASLMRGLSLSVLVAVPLAVAFGTLYSFRFAGPVHRIQQYFSGLRNGRWDTRCRLRKHDVLQDVAESINGAIDDVRDRIVEEQSILQDVKYLITQTVFTTDEASRELVARLQQRIEGSERDFARRFPDADMTPASIIDPPVARPVEPVSEQHDGAGEDPEASPVLLQDKGAGSQTLPEER